MKNNTGIFLVGGTLGILFLYSKKTSDTITPVNTSVLTPTNWFKKYYKDALASEQQTGVPALVTLAQAGIESNYGKSAPGNNFFGIKIGTGWNGKVQKLRTWECGSSGNPTIDKVKDEIITIYPPGSPNGNASCNSSGFYSYRVYGKFRAYDSAKQSFIDHGLFLKNNSRYKKAFLTATPNAFAMEIAKAGYATAPTYGSVISAVIDNIKPILNIV